ncbi:ATP-dependent DNA helicase PIF5 [Colletotrichum fructicola]|nr:ATP-dependent DNA helicase PIF5 [Colletotrichum fructicola]
MFVRLFVLFCALALGTLADRHHFCWCNSEQVPDHDLCLTQAACNYYPQDKFFGVHYGDPNAPTISKMNFKKQECYGTRAWPIIPHPFLGGNEFEDACYAAAADPAVMQLLREGFARESMAGHLPRSPTKPQRTAAGSSVKAGNGFPSEASSSKRPRLNNPSKYPESSHDAFVASANNELRGEKSFDEEDEVAPPPPPELPPLCPEQQRALELAINGENLFITGSGGCGKSRLVKALYDTLTAYGKTVHLLAPTGQAAVNIGGRTIFSYIGWRPDDLGLANSTLVAKARRKHIFSRIKSTEVLTIDEISMVERQVFERLSYVLSVI